MLLKKLREQRVPHLPAHPTFPGPPEEPNLNLNQNQWWCRRFLTSSVIPFLFLILAAFAETLEAVDRGGQEEARHDGRHRHGDAGEDDDEVIREGQVAAALSETFLRE